jgi:hypothetical protein
MDWNPAKNIRLLYLQKTKSKEICNLPSVSLSFLVAAKTK